MKKLAILVIVSASLFACTKQIENVDVRFVTSGQDVTQFRFTQGLTTLEKPCPFTGTLDTTLTVARGTHVKLESIAQSNMLGGVIYVNDVEVAWKTDDDSDGDGRAVVKLEYKIPE